MRQTPPQISILGCGWLGIPLARHLLAQGYSVKGSTTREEQKTVLSRNGIKPFRILLEEDRITGDIDGFLKHSEILLIDIPPGLRRDRQKDFTKVLAPLLRAAASSSIKNILYISSTSVFPDEERSFNELDTFEPDNRTGKQLRTAEAMVMRSGDGNNTVLRFGGLLGEDRHPVTFLSGRTDLPGGGHRINLIHRDDCIGLISAVLEKNYWGHILHGVAPCHLPKNEYYTRIAEQKGLTPPEFGHSLSRNKGKLINAALTAEWLEYTYIHPLCDS